MSGEAIGKAVRLSDPQHRRIRGRAHNPKLAGVEGDEKIRATLHSRARGHAEADRGAHQDFARPDRLKKTCVDHANRAWRFLQWIANGVRASV